MTLPDNAHTLKELNKEIEGQYRSLRRIERLLGCLRLTEAMPLLGPKEAKDQQILRALEISNGNKVQAARIAGVNVKTVYHALERSNKRKQITE